MKRYFILITIFLVVCGLSAYDEVFMVKQDGTGDFTNIQDAVDAVQTSAIIYVFGPDTYTGENNRDISWNGNSKQIYLWGLNNPVIDCEEYGRAFTINNGTEDDKVQGFTINNAYQDNHGGAILIINGCPQLFGNIFNNCSAGDYPSWYGPIFNGGAIYISNSNGANIQQNIFNDNSAFSGGAIYLQSGNNVSISNNTFYNNTSGHIYDDTDGVTGPAGAVHIASNNVTISNNIFQENRTNHGAAALAFMGSTCDINNNRFNSNKFGTLNTLGEYANCILGSFGSDCNIYDNIFDNNYAESYMYGIIHNNGTYTICNNTFINNSDLSSVFSFDYPTNEEITNCIFSNNESYSISWGDVTLNYCNSYQSGILGNGVIEGPGCLIDILPQIDSQTYQPLWNFIIKSPCIDTGDPASPLDPDDTPADMGAVRAIIHKYDIIELPSPEEDDGWKWLSFPALDVVLYGADIAENVLEDILDPAILDVVEAQLYTIYWYDDQWYNDDEQFLRTEGFKFHMNDDFTLDVPGFKVADNTTIALAGNNVENWVGYWLDETQHVSDAFSDYWSGSNINFIQHQKWTAFYLGRWRIMLYGCEEPTLSYGDMVVVKCNTTINNFQWESGTPVEKTVFAETEYFTFEEQADYIPLYIELDSSNMPQEIGAFVNGECIGAIVVEDTLVQINAYTTSVPPGNIELELYYGGRSENQHISSYNCMTSSNPNIIMKQLSTKKIDDAWFIDLREDSSMVPAPTKVSLSNYPNPFNPTTTISYSLPQEGKISLKIYNVKGQLVKQLIDGSQPEGYYEVVWNGKDNAGRSVASGIYYYRITACGKTINKKMLLLK